jgi:hypothetical protein
VESTQLLAIQSSMRPMVTGSAPEKDEVVGRGIST